MLCEACKAESGIVHMDRLCCIGRFLASLPSKESAKATAERWAQLYPYTVDDMRAAAMEFKEWKRGDDNG